MDVVVGIRLRRNGHSAVDRIRSEDLTRLRVGGRGSKKPRPRSMPQMLEAELSAKGSPWWAALSPSMNKRKLGKRGSSKALNSIAIDEETTVTRISVRRFVLYSLWENTLWSRLMLLKLIRFSPQKKVISDYLNRISCLLPLCYLR